MNRSSELPQRFRDDPGGTHYLECWRDHPACAYELGVRDERAATDAWTTRVAEASTDAATRADELEAENERLRELRDWIRIQVAGCLDDAKTLETATGLALTRSLIGSLHVILGQLNRFTKEESR